VPLVLGWTFGQGFLAKLYLNDEAGCLCIHYVAGAIAFIGTELISERIGRFNLDTINRSIDTQIYKQQRKIDKLSSSFALSM
jgi:ammonia channel protein AmtB